MGYYSIILLYGLKILNTICMEEFATPYHLDHFDGSKISMIWGIIMLAERCSTCITAGKLLMDTK